MLLTLKPPAQNGIKGPHEYSIVRQSIPTPRSSPPSVPDPSSTASTPTNTAPPSRQPANHHRSMDSSRRGLPPPSSMTLPPPDVGRPTMTPVSQLPPPPPQWQSPDDSMRHWLQARAEEDRRKQEEERTRQETLRLEQRRIEQGISGGSLSQSAMEIAQQFLNQQTPGRVPAPPMPQRQPSSGLDISSSTLPPPPPPSSMAHRRSHSGMGADMRRDPRVVSSHPYAAPPPPQQAFAGPGGPLPSQPLNIPVESSPTKPSLSRPPLAGGPPDPRVPASSRIHPADMQTQHPPINLSNAQYAPGSSIPHPPQTTSIKQDAHSRQSSSSIFFHHWVPPGHSQQPAEYHNSPGRKRKAQGPHQPPPLPSSRTSDGLSTFSQSTRQSSPGAGGRRGPHMHRRQQSDGSYESRAPDHMDSEHSNGPSPIHTAPPSSVLTPGDSSPEKSQDRVGGASVPESQDVEPPTQQQPPLSSETAYHYNTNNGNNRHLTSGAPPDAAPPLNDGDQQGTSPGSRETPSFV
ncbi:hypothetical protein ASPWEDRAFT_371733 [Aspergillus wentii DTO 134E9]|uniref:Uncharacterized protein n=1 Tax=Aspergillus wentii DTO 134E9 TaxID=1073089 RepID=A0A1L9RWS4_ASPWE|nr:uncharacterized protein ASPWEDRAFT_371733 [Aspergillus wentii DTO 134E9]OJJ39376.1 hypothetical protein ASPWEDRAFT_371733 [Aspergillus wentii DTO 134E9]